MQLWAYIWGKLRYKQISDNGPKKKKLPESSSQAKMQGSSFRDQCVIERGQHEATMKRNELQDA